MFGQRILNYRLDRKLGAGGMGEVYLAEDTKLKRQVALKFLPESLRNNTEARERLLREAQATSKLTHPNIVTVYAIDEHDGRDFIAMEYVDGSPLDDYVRDHQPSMRDILGLAIGIANGLDKAHKAGIVHRDLKPGNVLIDADGRAKIVDFGLAKLEGAEKLSQTGSTLGTVAYMSPEQAQGRDADHRADLFSLGVILYEMIAGRRPFHEDHEAAIIYAIVNEEPEPLARYKSDVSDELQQIVGKCLAKRPNERYQSAADLITDLKKAKRRRETGEPAGAKDQGLRSIAVLPFANMSADPDNEYFGDGLAEELLNALAGIQQLRVAARTSSFAYKGKDIDIREIGRQLNVAAVLEGSVRKAGNRIRVTAQLINVADGYHLWSQRYDREMEDVFAIQDEISDAIVAALKVTLAGKEKRQLTTRPTDNIEAYNLYLRGRYLWSKRTAEDLRGSITQFERAIELDPAFALAHVALADSWSLLCSYHILAPAESIPQAKIAAAKAMEIDSALAGAYEAKAHVRILDDWRWKDAEREYRHAIQLNPSYATARQRLALLLSVTGRTDEATDEISRAQLLEPLSLIINTDAGLISYIRREYAQAAEQCRQVLAMNDGFGVANFVLGLALEGLGEYDRAVAALHKAKSALGATTVISGSLGHAYARAGQAEEAQMILEEISELSSKRYVSPYGVGLIQLALGQADAALKSLQDAVEQRSVWLVHLHMAADPRLESLREDGEFQRLIPKLGLST
jgi:TolB-like protein/predicted Ser/Thr protein kinase/Tfp pilus assembly protein PilF